MRICRNARVVTVLVSLSVAVGACGGDDSGQGAAGQSGTSAGGGGQGGTAGQGGAAGGGGQAGTAGQAGAAGGDGGITDGNAEAAVEAGLPPCVTTDAAPVRPTPPAAIAVPASATLVAKFYAKGDQVYTCTDTGSDAGDAGVPPYTWVLKTPDAKLYNASCAEVGLHYLGPTWWLAADGSSVVGARLASAPSATAGAIAQLVLKATSHDADGGPGLLTNVTFVQRLDTVGGAAPASCTMGQLGQDLRVAYTANYYFYSGGLDEAGVTDAGGQ